MIADDITVQLSRHCIKPCEVTILSVISRVAATRVTSRPAGLFHPSRQIYGEIRDLTRPPDL